METLFFGYYGRETRHIKSPKVITALLVTTSEVLAKGIAICSDLDGFNRKRGQDIAHGRALKALKKHSQLPGDKLILPSFHFPMLRSKTKNKLFDSGHFPLVFTKGIAYPPDNCLTEQEKKAVERIIIRDAD